MVKKSPKNVRCPWKRLFITSLKKLKGKGLSEELQRSNAQPHFSGLLIVSTFPDILSLTAEKHSQEAQTMRVRALLLPSLPVQYKPHDGRALSQPRRCRGSAGFVPAALRSAGGRRARLCRHRPGQRSAQGRLRSGSLLLLFPAPFILLLPSPWQVDFWRPRPEGDAASPRRPPLRRGGCVHNVHTYICIIYMGVPG